MILDAMVNMDDYWYQQENQPVRVCNVTSVVELSFFSELARLKLDEFRLDTSAKSISGSMVRLNSLNKFHCEPVLVLDMSSFQNTSAELSNRRVYGTVTCVNTIEEFKSIDKRELLDRWGKEMMQSMMLSDSDSIRINEFHLLVFSDLKRYKFYYWIAHPVLHSLWVVTGYFSTNLESSIHEYVLLHPGDTFFHPPNGPRDLYVFLDSCLSRNRRPASHLRNHLYVLAAQGILKIELVIYRPKDTSFALYLKCVEDSSNPSPCEIVVTGWERNYAGNLGPKMADLGSLMDPIQLAKQAVNLNLKLMKWRVAPALDLSKIQDNRILLLGAGTLGCYVARALMAWGARNITFVDNGRVSYSNPVRQSLYGFEDCAFENGRGKLKALCAAQSLKQIFPGVQSRGVDLLVPMIGHPVGLDGKQGFETLIKLVSESDTIFLLMDLREARWLPSVLGYSMNKLVINAALGYDSYMVMRHGTLEQESQLGCYFCNDVFAPSDSLRDRTLDQMCTVTRPGGALVASAVAVELFASIIQHPEGANAGHGSKLQLGQVPHQIRGTLANFEQVRLYAPKYENCSACCDSIMSHYRQDGWDFIMQCLENSLFLERICGLEKVQAEAEVVTRELLRELEINEPVLAACSVEYGSQSVHAPAHSNEHGSNKIELDFIDPEWTN